MVKDRLVARAHIVEGLLRVLDDRLEFVALLASSDNRTTVIEALIVGWEMSEVQAFHAVDMTFGRSTLAGYELLSEELAELRKRIAELG